MFDFKLRRGAEGAKGSVKRFNNEDLKSLTAFKKPNNLSRRNI
jgi:hypothetical protein